MARTRGAKSSSLSSRKRAAPKTPVQGSTSEPPRPLRVPPPVEDAPMSPSVRRYHTRASSQPPKKRAKVSEPADIHSRQMDEYDTCRAGAPWIRTSGHSTSEQPEEPEEPQPIETPADKRAPASTVPSAEPIPEVAPSASPATPRPSPVIPATSEPSSSFEPRTTISISEYRALCHTLQALTTSQSILTQEMTALRAHQEQIIATQTQITPFRGD
ncbi:hypothetical protein AAG906_030882 [Vitis piasezkii]